MPSFKKIRERAARRKGGEAVLGKLLGPRPDNAALAKVPDDRILSTMAERIFSAGFVWSVIEAKWPGFEEASLGFEPKRLLFQPEDSGTTSHPTSASCATARRSCRCARTRPS